MLERLRVSTDWVLERRSQLAVNAGWITATCLPLLVLGIATLQRELPQMFHPDEPTNIGVAGRVVVNGDLNPHFFNYPSLFFYALAAVLVIAAPPSPLLSQQGLGITKALDPSAVVAMRSVTLAVGIIGVLLVFVAVRILTGRSWAAGVAGLLISVSPTYVRNATLITPDIYATVGVMGVLVLVLVALQRQSQGVLIAAAVAAGIAVSFKYTAWLALAMVAVAVFLLRGSIPWLSTMVKSCLAAAAAFVLTTPFSVLDPLKFVHDAGGEFLHYRRGHIGMSGDTVGWYLSYALTAELSLFGFLFLTTIAAALARQTLPVAIWPGAIFALLYILSIATVPVRNDRTLLLALPVLVVLAATSAASAAAANRPSKFTVAIVAIAALTVGTGQSIALTNDLNKVDNRELAADWIYRELPPGTAVVSESYGPWLDPVRFQVRSVFALDQLATEPGTGCRPGTALVTTAGMLARYTSDPVKYAAQVAAWHRVADTCSTKHVFDGGQGEVVAVLTSPSAP